MVGPGPIEPLILLKERRPKQINSAGGPIARFVANGLGRTMRDCAYLMNPINPVIFIFFEGGRGKVGRSLWKMVNLV